MIGRVDGGSCKERQKQSQKQSQKQKQSPLRGKQRKFVVAPAEPGGPLQQFAAPAVHTVLACLLQMGGEKW